MAVTVLYGENLASRGETTGHCVSIAQGLCPGSRVQVGSVQILLAARRPAAILGAIGSVVVNAVKARALGTLPHVLKERLKRTPARTDRDASLTIQVISDVVGIPASLSHRVPGVVRPGALPCDSRASVAVTPSSLTTPARPSFTVFEILPTDFLGHPTSALTYPKDASMLPLALMQDGQLPERLPSKINHSHSEIVPQKRYLIARHV